MKQTTVDSGYPIVPRLDVSFGLDGDIPKYWFGGDAFRSRFFDAMSTLFPEGEKFFITCVRDYRDGITDPVLKAQVADFMRQEAQHGRIHREFNDRLQAQGIRVDNIENSTRRLLARSRELLPAWFTLAQTAAAEHMTSIMAHGFFERQEVFADADPRIRAMYLWHGVEEIEHKAVAFDVLKHVAKANWFQRCGVMLYVSIMFPLHTFLIMRHMFDVDGFRGMARLRLWVGGLRWLYGWNGLFRPLAGHYLAYFRPGFHPWQDGDMGTYEQWRDAFEATGGDALAAGDRAHALAAS
jgi:predicted metal-dependent hydrolase